MSTHAAVAAGLPARDEDLPEGFRLPDWSEPLDVEACCRAIPEEATVKGMFLSSLVEQIRAHGGTAAEGERFHAFNDYPMRRCLELSVECARTVHPRLPLRDGLRHVSRPAYSTFADSLIGRVVFAALGRNVPRILGLASRAWRHAASVGRLDTRVADESTAIVRAEQFYLTEPVAVGIGEGVLASCQRPGLVAVRRLSPTEAEFLIRWR